MGEVPYKSAKEGGGTLLSISTSQVLTAHNTEQHHVTIGMV